MLRQLCGVLLQPGRVHLLQGPGHLLVQPYASRGEHLLIEGLPEEGVAEPEADHAPDRRSLFDHRCSLGLLQGSVQLLLASFPRRIRHPLQYV